MLRGQSKFLVVVLLAFVTSGFAKRMPKIFPATRASVPFENKWADTLGWQRYQTMRDIRHAVEAGELAPITATCDRRLPTDRRYARPQTVSFVEVLDNEFNGATGGRLVVNSAVRPTDVQKRLRRWNRNAAPATGASASSHERGATVDLSRRMSRSQYRWLVVRLAYYEARGRIHVIEERGCFHIFVGEEPNANDQRNDFIYVEIDSSTVSGQESRSGGFEDGLRSPAEEYGSLLDSVSRRLWGAIGVYPCPDSPRVETPLFPSEETGKLDNRDSCDAESDSPDCWQ